MWICVIACCSTFQQELEKCVDQPQKIGAVFIRYVSFWKSEFAYIIVSFFKVYTSKHTRKHNVAVIIISQANITIAIVYKVREIGSWSTVNYETYTEHYLSVCLSGLHVRSSLP